MTHSGQGGVIKFVDWDNRREGKGRGARNTTRICSEKMFSQAVPPRKHALLATYNHFFGNTDGLRNRNCLQTTIVPAGVCSQAKARARDDYFSPRSLADGLAKFAKLKNLDVIAHARLCVWHTGSGIALVLEWVEWVVEVARLLRFLFRPSWK
jgi:hypothetical protein